MWQSFDLVLVSDTWHVGICGLTFHVLLLTLVCMNQSSTYAYDSHFGPPSELLVIKDFLQQCKSFLGEKPGDLASKMQKEWEDLTEIDEEQKAAIESECRYDRPLPLPSCHLRQHREAWTTLN